MQRLPLIALFASAAMAASAQLLLKIGAAGRVRPLDFINMPICGGLVCLAGAAVIWIYALSIAPLYVVYPFTLLTFVLVGFASILILGEQPSALALGGWIVTLVGIGLISLGSM
jgi:drug/metabolite transporter (DMT)-like permease